MHAHMAYKAHHAHQQKLPDVVPLCIMFKPSAKTLVEKEVESNIHGNVYLLTSSHHASEHAHIKRPE